MGEKFTFNKDTVEKVKARRKKFTFNEDTVKNVEIRRARKENAANQPSLSDFFFSQPGNKIPTETETKLRDEAIAKANAPLKNVSAKEFFSSQANTQLPSNIEDVLHKEALKKVAEQLDSANEQHRETIPDVAPSLPSLSLPKNTLEDVTGALLSKKNNEQTKINTQSPKQFDSEFEKEAIKLQTEYEKNRNEPNAADKFANDINAAIRKERDKVAPYGTETSPSRVSQAGYELADALNRYALSEKYGLTPDIDPVRYDQYRKNGEYLASKAQNAADFETRNVYGKKQSQGIDAVKAYLLRNFPDLNMRNFITDPEHEWIGGQEGESVFDRGHDFFDAMTEEQKKILGYYIATDEEKAERYVEAITLDVGSIMAEKYAASADDWYDKLLYNIFSVGTENFNTGMQGAYRQLLGETGYQPPTPIQQGGAEIRYRMEQNGEDFLLGISDAGAAFVQMIPSFVVGAFSRTAGAALMGVSASGNAYNEAINKGLSRSQASTYATLVGASEALLEKALGSVGEFGGKIAPIPTKILKKIDVALSNVARNLPWDISEFGEEFIQSYIEPWFMSVVTNEEYEAPDFEEALYNGLIGAIVGGIAKLGGRAVPLAVRGIDKASQSIEEAKMHTDVGEKLLKTENANEDIKKLIDNAQQSGDKKLQKAANKVAKTEKDGAYDVSARKVGRLAQMSKEQLAQSLMDTATGNDLKSQTIEKLTESGMNQKGAERAFDLIARDASRGVESKELQSLINKNPDIRTMYDNMVEYLSEEAVTKRVEDVAKASPVPEITNRITEQRLKDAGIEVIDEATVEKDDVVDVDHVDEDGIAYVKTESGKVIPYKSDSLSISSASHKKMGYASLFGTNGAKTYFALAPETESSRYMNDFTNLYNKGAKGESFSIIESNISADVQKAIYEAGKADRDAAIERRQKAETEAKEKEAKFVKKQMGFKSDRVTLSEEAVAKIKSVSDKGISDQYKAAVKVIDGLAKMLQVNINIVASETDASGNYIGARGMYNRATNTFTFDIMSGMDNVAEISYSAMIKTAGHELTHFIQNWSPSKYLTLKNTTLKFLKDQNDAAWIAERLDEIRSDNEAIGKKLTLEQAKDELVADAFEDVLSNIDFAETILRTDKTLFDKIHSWVKKNVNDFKKNLGIAVKDVEANSEAAKEMRNAGKRAQALYDQWADAFSTALENSTSGQTGVDVVNNLNVDQEVFAEIEEELAKPDTDTQAQARRVTKEQDTAYMDAVNRGDMETAQRMVDEAAKEAGYTVKAYHGTKADFTKFSKEKFGDNFGNWSLFGAGFYFAPTEERAMYWGSLSKGDTDVKVMPVYLRGANMLSANEPLKNDKAIDIVKNNAPSFDNEDIKWTLDRVSRFVDFLINKGYTANGVRELFVSMGYDGVDYSHPIAGKYRQYVVFDSEQVKSADPITYDDNGNVIPLSERFNPENEDIRYSARPQRDSEGNNLTDAQQEFFKDSKVRDKNGNLLVVRHGTDADFNIFDFTKSGKNGKAEGYGFYFSDDPEITNKYGAKQKEVYLNITKPLYNNKRTINKAELIKLTNALIDFDVEKYKDEGLTWQDSFLSNYVMTYDMTRQSAVREFVNQIWNYNTTDQDLVFEIAQGDGRYYDSSTMKEFYEVLTASIGYDGIIAEWKHEGGTSNVYVTFESNQSKNTTNTNPTADPDIRYQARKKTRFDVNTRLDLIETAKKNKIASDAASKGLILEYQRNLRSYQAAETTWRIARYHKDTDAIVAAATAMQLRRNTIASIECTKVFAELFGKLDIPYLVEETSAENGLSETALQNAKEAVKRARQELSEAERDAIEWARRIDVAGQRVYDASMRRMRLENSQALNSVQIRIKQAMDKPNTRSSIPVGGKPLAEAIMRTAKELNKLMSSKSKFSPEAETIALIKEAAVIGSGGDVRTRSVNTQDSINIVDEFGSRFKAEFKALTELYGNTKESKNLSFMYDEEIHMNLDQYSADKPDYDDVWSYIFDCARLVRAVAYDLTNANTIMVNKRAESYLELRGGLEYDFMHYAPKKMRKVLANAASSIALTPEVFIHSIFGHTENANKFNQIYDDGQNKYIDVVLAARGLFAEIEEMTDKNGKKLYGEANKKKLLSNEATIDLHMYDGDGNKVLTNEDHAISFILAAKNADYRRHIMYGGWAIPDLKKANKGKNAYLDGRTTEHILDGENDNGEIIEYVTVERGGKKIQIPRIDFTMIDNMRAEANRFQAIGEIDKAIDLRCKLALANQEIKKIESDWEKKILEAAGLAERQLSSYANACMQKLDIFYNNVAKAFLDEATEERYGFKKTLEKNHYYPIQVVKEQATQAELNTLVKQDYRVSALGSMKRRVRSKISCKLYGAVSSFAYNVENTAKYYGYLNTLNYIKKITGVSYDKMTDAKGKKKQTKEDIVTLGSYVNRNLGNTVFTDYLYTLESDLSGGKGMTTAADVALDFIYSGFIADALVSNLSPTTKQIPALLLVYPDAGLSASIKGIIKGATTKGDAKGKTKLPMGLTEAQKRYVARYSRIYKYRSGGLVDADLSDFKQSNHPIARFMSKHPTLTGTNWMERTDSQVLGLQFYAILESVKKSNPNLSAQEAATKAGEILDKTIQHFQANSTVLQRAPLLRSKGSTGMSLARVTIGTFKSQQLTMLNAKIDSLLKVATLENQIKELEKSNKREDAEKLKSLKSELSRSKKYAARVAAATMVSYIVNAAFTVAIQLLYKRTDDEDELWEIYGWDLLQSFVSIVPGVGDAIYYVIEQLTDNGYYGDSFAEVGLLGVINDVFDVIGSIGDGEYTVDRIAKDIGKLVAPFGVPARNVWNIVKAIFKWIGVEVE